MTSEKLKQYFELSPIDNNRTIGICKLCHRAYKDLYGIYSNFKKHLKRQHPYEYQKSFCLRPEDDPSGEIDVLPDDPTAATLDNNRSKSSRINLTIIKNLIIKCNLPLNLIENPAFRDFMRECVPKWEPMSVKKLKQMIITSFKERVHKIVYETLQNVNHLSLTIDGWSDRRGRGFLGITCHFLDNQMLPQAYLVDFVRMKSPHTSDNIQRQTEYVLDSFNIKEKVFRIITDNASNMVKAYKFGLSVEGESGNSNDQSNISMCDCDTKVDDDHDEENFDVNSFDHVNVQQESIVTSPGTSSPIRVSCFAHTLQLAIREGLQKVPQITKILEKAKILARCSQKSTKIADLLDQLHKHIERTTITRWNSEFMLIKSIWSITREDLESIASLMDNPVRFSTNDLAIMAEVIEILEPFYQISLKCQAEKIATVSMVVPSIVHLIGHLQTFKENVIVGDTLAQQLQTAIERRFAGIINRLKLLEVKDDDPFSDPLYFMAAVLDPAFRFYWIYDLKLPASMETRLKQHVVQIIIDEISKDSKPSSTAVRASVEATNVSLASSPASVSAKSKIERRKLFVYDDYRCKNNSSIGSRVSEPSEELESYLNNPSQSSFSEYWQRSRLAAMKNLVFRLFSVQASSAPVERVFSHAGLIFSSRRTRMTAQLFQDLVFLKVNQSLL